MSAAKFAVRSVFDAAELEGFTIDTIDSGCVVFLRSGDQLTVQFDESGQLAGARIIGARHSAIASLRADEIRPDDDPFRLVHNLIAFLSAPLASAAAQ